MHGTRYSAGTHEGVPEGTRKDYTRYNETHSLKESDMYRRAFTIVAEVNDIDSDLLEVMPDVMKARFEGTAVNIVEISSDLPMYKQSNDPPVNEQ
jgi:hypothetical protein